MRPVQSHLNKSLETVDENLSIEEEQLPINPLSIRIEDKELTEEQLRRKYPFSYGQVSAKGTGIEGAKEGLTQAADLATDVAPFVGSAKALTELPEDAQFAKQLIEEGYDEGDIKKMGLGAGFGTLTALGFLPGAKIATDLGKRAVKEGVAETASDVAAQTRAAFKADPSSMDSAAKKRLIEESKKLPPDMRRKFIKEGMRPTPKLFHGSQGIGDVEVDDTQLLADIEEAQRSGVTMPMKEIYKMNNGSTIDADEFFMQAATKGISIPHVQGLDEGGKYLDFRRIEDGGETENGLRVIKLVSDDNDLTRRVVVPQKDGKIELFAIQEKIKEHMQMNQDATETFKRSPDSLVSRGEKLAREGFEPFGSFKGARGLTSDRASGRHAELKEKALSMSRDPLVSMKPVFGGRRLDNIVYSDLPMSLQRNIKPVDYDDISDYRVTLGEVISKMTDEEIDKVFNNAPEFYEAMKEGSVNLNARIVPSEAAAKRNIGLSLPKSTHLEAETAILEPQELGVSRLSTDSDEVRDVYPMRYGIKTKRKRKKDLGKLPLEERVREGQKLANTVLDRMTIIEDSGGKYQLRDMPVTDKGAGGAAYNYQAIKEMFTDLQSLGQFTEQYGARGTYDSLIETIAQSRRFRNGLTKTADAFKDVSPEKYKNLKMLEVLVNHPRMLSSFSSAEEMSKTQMRGIKDKELLDFIESDVGMPPELRSTGSNLAYNDVKRAMFLLTQKLNRGGLMAKR